MVASESQAVPDANSPAATMETSTPRGRNSLKKWSHNYVELGIQGTASQQILIR